MTKAEFVSEIAEKAGISKAAAARAVDAVLDARPVLSPAKRALLARRMRSSGAERVHVGETSAVRELALSVWENPQDADEFLTTPHGLLEGETPLEAARTPEGANRVREILLALEYGLPV